MNIIQSVWDFFQNEVLGMRWLNAVLGRGLSALGLDTASRWGGSSQFLLSDVVKITLCNFVISLCFHSNSLFVILLQNASPLCS